jgi:hypothetical protein
MKSFILASMMTVVPAGSMETHLLGDLGRMEMLSVEDVIPAPATGALVAADPVKTTKVVASCSDCATGAVKAVFRTQPIRSCISRQPVRSCARRAVSVRPLQRLFSSFRRCR